MKKKLNTLAEHAAATSCELQQKAEIEIENAAEQLPYGEAPTENTAELLPDESEVMTARKGRNPQKPNEVIEIPAKKIVKQ